VLSNLEADRTILPLPDFLTVLEDAHMPNYLYPESLQFQSLCR